jgi:hypothetical protein
MTIAVGLVGLGGIVLAADSLVLEPAIREDHYCNRIESPKVVHAATGRLAYVFCGDECAKIAGQEMVRRTVDRELDFANLRGSLESVGDDTFANQSQKQPNFFLLTNRRIIVVFYGQQVHPAPQMWELTLREHGSRAVPISGSVVIGATGNGARFFQHYFTGGQPSDRLKFLAAHIVLTARDLDTFAIEGLDLAVITASGFEWVTDREKADLAHRSRELATFLRTQFVETHI